MVTVKRLHCDRISTIMIYSDNIITCKHTSNVCSDPKEWSHSSMVRNCIFFHKYKNQQQWRWNDTIVHGEEQWWPPLERRGDRGAVTLQDWSPSTAPSPLKMTGTEAVSQGGVYGDNMISQQSNSDVSSDPNEWSHS